MKILDVEQGSCDWMKERIGKITGTRIAQAIGTVRVQDTLMNEMLTEMLTGEPAEKYVTQAMANGTYREPQGIAEWEAMTGILTDVVGMCVHDEFPWLVNSPDRLIEVSGEYREAIEIKCPEATTAVKWARKGGVPNEHRAQCIGYFLVNEKLERLRFLVYCPEFAGRMSLVETIMDRPKEEELSEVLEKLKMFHEKLTTEHNKLISKI